MSGKNLLRSLFGAAKSSPAVKMPSVEAVEKLEARALQAENLIEFLKVEVGKLQKALETNKANESAVNMKQYEELRKENQKLRNEIEEWKKRLISTEEKLNIVQVDVGTSLKESNTLKERVESLQMQQPSAAVEEVAKSKESKKEKVKPVKDTDSSKKAAASAAEKQSVDVGRLDIRVGKIVSVVKHPDADSLYVEEVDVGEGKPRTVVSGLVKYVPIDELKDRMVVLLCNLKPAKMKGVSSEAMVLCASTPEKVEVLIPPKGCVPGDKVHVEGFPREPDDVLNPKKKIFETVAVDLKTDEKKTATYKGVPFQVPGKGFVTTTSLINVNIK